MNSKLIELLKTASVIALQIAECLEKQESKYTQMEINFDEEPEEVKRTRRPAKRLPFGVFQLYTRTSKGEVVATVNKETGEFIHKTCPSGVYKSSKNKLRGELLKKAIRLHPDYQEFQQYPIAELF